MSGWDDLFDLAAGIDNHDKPAQSTRSTPTTRKYSESISNPLTIEPDTKNNSQAGSRKKRKKKKGTSAHNTINNEVYQEVLRSRMDPIETQIQSWPTWMKVGPFLTGDDTCEELNQSKSDETCNKCSYGTTPLYHSITVDMGKVKKASGNQSMSLTHLEMFCLIRNIRCCGSAIVVSTLQDGNAKDMKSVIKKLVVSSLHMAKSLMNQQDNLINEVKNDGERKIFNDKCKAILLRSKKLLKKVKSEGYKLLTLFDELLQVIMSCDAAYYRLYYLQLAGFIQPFKLQNNIVLSIPHPPTYFGTNYLAWDLSLGERVKKEFLQDLKENLGDVLSEMVPVMNQFGINEDQLGGRYKEICTNDPLLYMHENRYMESILLFWRTGWMDSKKAIGELHEVFSSERSTDEFYSNLETPAPSILEEWRDSCRDLLCSLYAYATLPNGAVDDVNRLLKEYNIHEGIIEVGAGTGYMARILGRESKYTAFDVAPTKLECHNENPNEYHGSTPSFYTVQKYQNNTIPTMMRGKNKGIALLLSYPPPQSTMAHDTLRTYLNASGRMLIHIGEFHGLTGSIEKLLLENFELVHFVQCPIWGTDASQLTVWVRSSKPKHGGNRGHIPTLLPCSNCSKESSKQCRFMRSLNYCSSRCFDAHKKKLVACMRISLLPTTYNAKDVKLDFKNEAHFRSI